MYIIVPRSFSCRKINDNSKWIYIRSSTITPTRNTSGAIKGRTPYIWFGFLCPSSHGPWRPTSPIRASVETFRLRQVNSFHKDFHELFLQHEFFQGLRQFPIAYRLYLSRKEFRYNDRGIDTSFHFHNASLQSYNYMLDL